MIEETISIENASFPLEASLYGRDFRNEKSVEFEVEKSMKCDLQVSVNEDLQVSMNEMISDREEKGLWFI